MKKPVSEMLSTNSIFVRPIAHKISLRLIEWKLDIANKPNVDKTNAKLMAV
jgi:hypothetical protein